MESVKKVVFGIVLLNFIYGVISLIQLGVFLPLLPLEGVFISIIAIVTCFIAYLSSVKYGLLIFSFFHLISSPVVYSSILTYEQVIVFETYWLDIFVLTNYVILGLLFGFFLLKTFNKWFFILPIILFYITSIIFNNYVSPMVFVSGVCFLLLTYSLIFKSEEKLLNHFLSPFFMGISLLIFMNKAAILLV